MNGFFDNPFVESERAWQMKPEVSVDSEVDLVFSAGEAPAPLVTEGYYEVSYVKHVREMFCGVKKLYVWFQIVSHGEHSGVVLFKAFNFYEPLPRGSDLFKSLQMIYGYKVSKKTKLPMSLFKGRIIQAYVRTVKSNRKQDKLLSHQLYSVVDRLISVSAGGSDL